MLLCLPPFVARQEEEEEEEEGGVCTLEYFYDVNWLSRLFIIMMIYISSCSIGATCFLFLVHALALFIY
jgi:hypothetical protein